MTQNTLRVVVGDKSQSEADAMAERFAAAGHRVIAKTCVPTLVCSAARAHDPDLLVVGQQVGAEDGLEVARRVNAGTEVPVIQCVDTFSGFQDADDLPTVVFVRRDASEAELQARAGLARARHDRDGQLRQDIQRLKRRLKHEPKIARAKGLLMEELGLDEERAYGQLRKASQDRRIQLHKVAEEILANGVHVVLSRTRRM
ncbi:MAG: ANTAR domain-containing response regulator [Chloroflexota bacterium]